MATINPSCISSMGLSIWLLLRVLVDAKIGKFVLVCFTKVFFVVVFVY